MSPEKEILIRPPHSLLPASVPETSRPSHPQDTLSENPKMRVHTHVLLLGQATWPFPMAAVDLEGYEHWAGRGD